MVDRKCIKCGKIKHLPDPSMPLGMTYVQDEVSGLNVLKPEERKANRTGATMASVDGKKVYSDKWVCHDCKHKKIQIVAK